jgi:hypothetical protein
MTTLLFAVALSLSAVAAWYAIAGLIAIFAAAAIPIAIMGSLLEASKLVIASWLYRNWKEVPKLLKTYFLVALIVLMALTSMGIFGFLSKAHLDQAIPTDNVVSQVALLDEKINIQKENINAARKQITQLDTIADQTIARTDDAKGIERANQIRRSQQKDRNRLLAEIGEAQKEIARLNDEKAPIAKDLRKIEAEVGPIKYIAALIYGDNPDSSILEKAVRIVILMIVAVFDPLAVLLLVAANWNLKHLEKKDEFWRLPKVPKEMPNTSITKTEETKEEIKLDLKDDLSVQENVAVEEPSVKDYLAEYELNKSTGEVEKVYPEDIPVSVLEEELPEIKVDEPTKDWEPELYAKAEKKTLGRYMQEIGAKPPLTQSFLNKVQTVFNEPSVGVKTIEREVEELQDKNPK